MAVLDRHTRDTTFQKRVCLNNFNLTSQRGFFFQMIRYNVWTSPLNRKGNQVVDAQGHVIKHYPEVPDVLKELHNEGYELGVASRTSETQGANQLLKLLGWDKYFKYKEIYPGCKVTHFTRYHEVFWLRDLWCVMFIIPVLVDFYRIQKNSSVNLTEMLFFDDEDRNIHDLTKIGVTSILVRNGVSREVVKNGLSRFSK